MTKQRVIVAMSGGVDSCVAAALLVDQGFDVIGITMRLWTVERPEELGHQHCCSVEDTDDAREVASMLGIPHYVLNFERDFHERVVEYFVDAYARGLTPNPCQACNEHIKFRALMARSEALDADLFATGHYARVQLRAGSFELLRGVDPHKDQSYFLYTLSQQELSRLCFPLGGFGKQEVRAMARRFGLPVAEKPDSEEICFVPGNDYRRFLDGRIERVAGAIVDREGRELGRHDGIMEYTIGQRRGLGAFGDRRYVIALDPVDHRVVVGGEDELFSSGLVAGSARWIRGAQPPDGSVVHVKVRARAEPAPAMICQHPDGFELRFEQPQRAVAPGQIAVCYDGAVVLGGGTIRSASPRNSEETLS